MREYYARFCENLGLKCPGLLDNNKVVCVNDKVSGKQRLRKSNLSLI